MGRLSLSQTLAIWCNGELLGHWRQTHGQQTLIYHPGWVDSPAGRPLSRSLPLGVGTRGELKGEVVANYFDNLLPDSTDIRKRLAARHKAISTKAFDMLLALGRDCVGAVQLLPEGQAPAGFDRIEGVTLDDRAVDALLLRTVSAAGLGASGPDDDDLRISLAGAQEKTALLWHQGRWMRPLGATPTTHILKLPLGLVGNRKINLSSSVDNEWLCLALLRAYGLPAAEADIVNFGGQRVLAVRRFDRALHPSGAWWMRLPQEDFCQTLGLPSFMKYESDGGPGLRALGEVLKLSVQPERDLATLFSSQVLFWMLAAPDGHAKNFSLQLLPQGRYRLTPLYDVMSIWPAEGPGPGQWNWHKTKLAMALLGRSRHKLMKSVLPRHFESTVHQLKWNIDPMALMQHLVERTPDVIAQVSASLPPDFDESVAQTIFGQLIKSAEKLSDGCERLS